MRFTFHVLRSSNLGWALSFVLLTFLLSHTRSAAAQVPANRSYSAGEEQQQEVSEGIPEIKDEPRTIDPADVLPKELATRVTVDFSDSSLREMIEWLETEQGLVVILETNAIEDVGITSSEPISDSLNNEPIYLLLNRLRSLTLGWYFENDIVYITTLQRVKDHLTSETYNVGDLLDQGYKIEAMQDLIMYTIDPESWDEVGGDGALYVIGDVMFINQTQRIQYKVQGLLKALRGFGRRTLTFDPPEHEAIRQALRQPVSVAFVNRPLEEALGELGEKSGVRIRLDSLGLRDVGIRDREPVMLSVRERPLETILGAMLNNLGLTWILQDGLIWVTNEVEAESNIKNAVYDVRDLCRNANESSALIDAIQSQYPEYWDNVGGPYQMESAKPGILVVSANERIQDQVLALLEAYRTALRASKVRDREKLDPNEVITVYYKLHTNVASALRLALPELVAPGSWRTEEQADAHGTIRVLPSTPVFADNNKVDSEANAQAFAARSVLIVTQSRTNQRAIQELIKRVQLGDRTEETPFGRKGMSGGTMGGMGGFGGGYFRVLDSMPFGSPQR